MATCTKCDQEGAYVGLNAAHSVKRFVDKVGPERATQIYLTILKKRARARAESEDEHGTLS